MSYRFLEHATDAIVEIDAKDRSEAFAVAAQAVIDLTIDSNTVTESDQIHFSASGKDLHYLLFSWLEEIVFVLITKGFAIGRLKFDMKKINDQQTHAIDATAYGEEIDLLKHHFKVEIKAPTFHDMEIVEKENKTYMRFLLDL